MAIVLKVKRSGWNGNDVLPDTMALEVGDVVATVEKGYSGRTAHFRTVEKVTPKQVVLHNGTRYRREDGVKVGDPYGARLHHVGHPEVLAAQQEMVTRALTKKVNEIMSAKFGSSADVIKALRSVQMHARQAAERVELLEQQAEESAAQMALIQGAPQ